MQFPDMRMPGFGIRALLAFWAPLAWVPLALATDATASLTVTDPTGCLSETRLKERVESILGRTAFRDLPAFSVTVLGSEATIEVRITSLEGELAAQRTLDVPQLACEDRLGTTAVIIAVLFDAPETEVVLHVPPEPPQVESQESATPQSATIGVFFGAFSLGTYGWLPELSAGALLEGGLLVGDWAIGMGLELFPEGKLETSPGAAFMAWAGSVEVAFTLARFESLSISILGRCAAGVMRAVGQNADRVYERLEPTLAAEIGVRLSVSIAGPLSFVAELAGAAAIVRPSFRARIGEAEVVVYEPAWVHPSLSLGLVLLAY